MLCMELLVMAVTKGSVASKPMTSSKRDLSALAFAARVVPDNVVGGIGEQASRHRKLIRMYQQEVLQSKN